MENWLTNNPPGDWTYEQAADLGADVFYKQNPHCNRECLKQQIIEGHKKMGVNPGDPLTPSTAASEKSAPDREIMELARDQLREKRMDN